MSEAAGGRAEIEQRLVQRSVEDESFRQGLLADPRAVVEQELGTPLPESMEIRAVEETSDTIYLVLPPASAPDQTGGTLSDEELETVAGGGGWGSDESQCICSNFC